MSAKAYPSSILPLGIWQNAATGEHFTNDFFIQIVEELSEGGMGVVYVAEGKLRGRCVAI